jgi:hypothetical protein
VVTITLAAHQAQENGCDWITLAAYGQKRPIETRPELTLFVGIDACVGKTGQ